IIRIMGSPLLGGGGGVYPWLGSVFPGSGLSGGVGYLARYPEGMRFNSLAGVSINGSYRLEGTFVGPRFASRTLRPRVVASYVDAKRVSFYGLGPESLDEPRARYDFTPKSVAAELAFTPADWFQVDGGFEFLAFGTSATDPDPLLFSGPAFGSDLRYQISRGTVAFDTRTSPGYSTHGTLLRATHELFDERRDLPFDFRRTELEAVQLVPILHEQFVLAFRGLMTMTHSDGDDDVPLPLLPYIGGGSTVRGLSNRRFADRNRAVLTAEYRWLPSRVVDMAIFVDTGQVVATRDAFRLPEFETAYGIGMRIHGPTFTALRIEGAKSSRGFVLVFAAGPAF
ncbi:MAG: outer membrane protein assembly factor, partial [Chloroflexota bacterium]|nr:outer membrane protein assembly factor [Chloroflexota bacterium]